jgi:hypothetical protein
MIQVVAIVIPTFPSRVLTALIVTHAHITTRVTACATANAARIM